MSNDNFQKKYIKTWDGLIKTINNEFVNYPNYIFRGHSQSNWLLESSLNRALRKLHYDDKKVLVSEHLEKFRTEIRGRRGLHPKELNEDEIWALGQHYGLYTPLLDWSESPYVALFFAFAETKKSSTGKCALWALHKNSIQHLNNWYKSKNLLDKSVTIVNPSLDENNRLVSQRGLFTKISEGNDIESWVLKSSSFADLILIKYEFPQSIKETAMSYLNLMNINYSSLFPDLFGSSMVTNIYLEQSDYVIDNQNKEKNK